MIFNYTECSACPHECTRRTFDRNVEYGKYHEPIYRTLQKFSLSTGKQGNKTREKSVQYEIFRYRYSRVPSIFSVSGNNNSPSAIWLYYRSGSKSFWKRNKLIISVILRTRRCCWSCSWNIIDHYCSSGWCHDHVDNSTFQTEIRLW